MNDHVATELRRHLLKTADERPADGQFAALVERVAVTPQRHTLAARLTWSLDRIGPFPTVAFRYALIAATLIVAMAAAAALIGGSRGASTVFEGAWTTTDPVDGSAMHLTVASGSVPAVRFVDTFASGPVCRGDAVKVFTADGTGTIDGDRLDVEWPDGGGCGLMTGGVGPDTYTYDEATDALIDGQELRWSRAAAADVPSDEPSPSSPPASLAPSASPGPTDATEPSASLAPSASPGPTDATGPSAFTSTVHGISVDPPTGWVARPATEPWTGGGLTFDSPAADVIFDPALEGGRYFIIASYPRESGSEDGIGLAQGLDCGDGGAGGRVTVDGVSAFDWHCDGGNAGVDIETETRGYLIALVAAGTEAGLGDPPDFDALLETVDLRPEEAIDLPAVSGCTQFTGSGVYSGRVGPLTVGVTVPASSDTRWAGQQDVFSLTRADCMFGGPWLDATVIGQVYADACDRVGGSVVTDTPSAAIAALAAQTGVERVGPIDVTVDGYPGARFDMSIPAGIDVTACTDGVAQVFDGVANDLPATVVVVDVDGVALGLVFHWFDDEDPTLADALAAEVDAMIASMRIEP